MGTPLLNKRYGLQAGFGNRGASTIRGWAAGHQSHELVEGSQLALADASGSGSDMGESAALAADAHGLSSMSMMSVMSSSIPTFQDSSVSHYQDWRKTSASKARVDVQRMRERLRKLDDWKGKSMEDVLTPAHVETACKNLDRLKQNTSGFLRAKARQTAVEAVRREEEAAGASKTLLQAAADGKLADCRRLILEKRHQLEYLRIVAVDGRASREGRPVKTPGLCAKLINGIDGDGRTPLHHAACHGHADVAEFLLSEAAEVNKADTDGFTALHFACRWGRTNVVDMLVWAPGLEIDAKDKWGQTALHVVATCGHHNLVHVLVGRGADLHARNCDGESPAQVAKDSAVATALRWATHGPDNESGIEPGHNEVGEYVSDVPPHVHAEAHAAGPTALSTGDSSGHAALQDRDFGVLALMEALRDEFEMDELRDEQVSDIVAQFEQTEASRRSGAPCDSYIKFVHDFGHKHGLLELKIGGKAAAGEAGLQLGGVAREM